MNYKIVKNIFENKTVLWSQNTPLPNGYKIISSSFAVPNGKDLHNTPVTYNNEFLDFFQQPKKQAFSIEYHR